MHDAEPGLPVASVSQAYADNLDLIADGVNGMLATTDAEWLEKMRLLIDDAGARRSIAANGLRTVRDRFSRLQIFEQLLHAIESI